MILWFKPAVLPLIVLLSSCSGSTVTNNTANTDLEKVFVRRYEYFHRRQLSILTCLCIVYFKQTPRNSLTFFDKTLCVVWTRYPRYSDSWIWFDKVACPYGDVWPVKCIFPTSLLVHRLLLYFFTLPLSLKTITDVTKRATKRCSTVTPLRPKCYNSHFLLTKQNSSHGSIWIKSRHWGMSIFKWEKIT